MPFSAINAPMRGAAAWPRPASGRLKSFKPGSSQLELAWRNRESVTIPTNIAQLPPARSPLACPDPLAGVAKKTRVSGKVEKVYANIDLPFLLHKRRARRAA